MKKIKQNSARPILQLNKETMRRMTIAGGDATITASERCTYSDPGPSYTFYSHGQTGCHTTVCRSL